MRHLLFIVTGAIAVCATSLSAQTVAVSLSSQENGDTVTPGTLIHWSIGFAVSTGDNAGLALLVVDLAQAESNPEKFDLPPAEGVPPSLVRFSRPLGISNPGEANPVTGYGGVQRGAPGEKNLRQIGGAQNTFGEGLSPGSGVAENAVVVGGVGQNGVVTLASGTFAAPSTSGTYVFQLRNPVANVLTIVNPVSQFSLVKSADMALAAASFTFTVSTSTCESCDVNCDGESNASDIQSFVSRLVLSSSTGCSACSGDLNGSGDVTEADIAPFLACLLGA